MDFGLSSPVQGGQSPVQRTLGGTRQTNTLTLVGLAIGHDIEWIVVVAYQRWTVGAKPDRLCTSLQKRWRSELTEYLRCKIVFADEGAHPLIRAEQFRHVSLERCLALGRRRRRPSSRASIPSFGFGFGAACDEALPPSVAWGVLAYRDEALLHVQMLRALIHIALYKVSAPACEWSFWRGLFWAT